MKELCGSKQHNIAFEISSNTVAAKAGNPQNSKGAFTTDRDDHFASGVTVSCTGCWSKINFSPPPVRQALLQKQTSLED